MKKYRNLLAAVICLSLLAGCTGRPADETLESTEGLTLSSEPTAQQASEPTAGSAALPPDETLLPTAAPTEPATQPPTVPPTEPATQPPTVPPPEPATQPPTVPPVVPVTDPAGDMKAMWLSQFDLADIYRDGSGQRGQADFTARMAGILDNIRAQGFNTVILQVRPYADSMYPSAYYPMSACVTGRTGGQASYDPVEIIVRQAHQRDLSIHAWINPMRGMTEAELQQVGTEYAIRRWYDDPALRGRYIVAVNGRWYLNPAYTEVAELIWDGAAEVLRLYDFDGLHMDDYFYPTAEPFFDAEAYAADGGGRSLAEFRRGVLNELVSGLYRLTHEAGADLIYGISPAGNVNTVYNSQFADVYTWCGQAGYIDYICPQVYFGLEHGSFDFVKVCNTYQDMIRTDSVDLIVGMTFGKALTGEDQWAGSGREEWKNNKDVLARCLQTTEDLERCRGVAVFCYQYFFDPLTGKSVPETEQERENFIPLLQSITWQ